MNAGPRRAPPAVVPPGWRGTALLAALGGAAATGQAPLGLWPVTLIALAVFFRLAPAAGWRRGFLTGWALGLGYFALSLHWIVQPFLVDAARHGWMAPFALILMAGGMALFWGGAVAVAMRARRNRRLALATALVAAEVIRSHILTGFPWALLGHVWIGTPVSQAAAWIGPHGLTMLTVGTALALGWAGLRLVAVLPVAILAVGWLGLDPGPVNQASDGPVVRIVQPNAAQDQKWQPGMARMFFERQLELTRSEADAPRPDLVVWPETAIPWLLEQAGPALEQVSRAADGRPVILGVQRREARRYYNSLAVVSETGLVADLYDKHHIVPFGEYMPLEDLLRGLIEFFDLPMSSFSAGPAGQEPLRAGAFRVGLVSSELRSPGGPAAVDGNRGASDRRSAV